MITRTGTAPRGLTPVRGRLTVVASEEVAVAVARRTPGARPLVVVEDDLAYRAVLEELMGAGWRISATPQQAGPGTVVVCRVTEPGDAGWAVLAATQGGVVVQAEAGREVVDDLVDDLARLGPVVLLSGPDAVALDQHTWRLLHHLAGGSTVGAAARMLHMSLRTANRRLAEAREALGASGRVELLRALNAPGRIPRAGG